MDSDSRTFFHCAEDGEEEVAEAARLYGTFWVEEASEGLEEQAREALLEIQVCILHHRRRGRFVKKFQMANGIKYY